MNFKQNARPLIMTATAGLLLLSFLVGGLQQQSQTAIARTAETGYTDIQHISVEHQGNNATKPSLTIPEFLVQQKTIQSTSLKDANGTTYEIAFVLPPRAHRVWDGDIAFAASKPVTLAVTHPYNGSAIDATHGKPHTITLVGGKEIAVTLGEGNIGDTVLPPMTSISGGYAFAGTGIAFYSPRGEPFTVSYSVKATSYGVTPDSNTYQTTQ